MADEPESTIDEAMSAAALYAALLQELIAVLWDTGVLTEPGLQRLGGAISEFESLEPDLPPSVSAHIGTLFELLSALSLHRTG